MRFRRGEQAVAAEEPQVLGVAVDPESAALYDEFAQGRSLDEIYQVWKDPAVTNPTIRQRATAVLTAPYGYDVPYAHSDQSIGRLLTISEEVDGKKTSSLRERLVGRPELAHELARGVLYWLGKTGGNIGAARFDSRHSYQAAVQELLPIVDEDTADKLFTYFSLNDIESYWDLDSSSGYKPAVSLLGDPAIPRKYKDRCVAAWFNVAEREEQGAAQPREEHERAIKKMAEFASTWTYGEDVDDDIHTAIIEFIENHVRSGVTYANGGSVRQIADHITNENVKFNFVWRHVVVDADEDWDRFSIHNDKDLALVEWIKQESHRRGSTLYDARAETLVQEYEVKRRKRAAAEAAELALQARLRA